MLPKAAATVRQISGAFLSHFSSRQNHPCTALVTTSMIILESSIFAVKCALPECYSSRKLELINAKAGL